MKRYFGYLTLLVVLVLSPTSFAKDAEQKCWIGDLSTVEHRDGVTVRTVSFLDQTPPDPEANTADVKKKEKVNAHVYIPDSANPVPAILFSHSAIHNYQGTTSLLPFAMAMARAGAASIVLDRTIQWEPYDEAANLDHSVMDCAAKWFLSEV